MRTIDISDEAWRYLLEARTDSENSSDTIERLVKAEMGEGEAAKGREWAIKGVLKYDTDGHPMQFHSHGIENVSSTISYIPIHILSPTMKMQLPTRKEIPVMISIREELEATPKLKGPNQIALDVHRAVCENYDNTPEIRQRVTDIMEAALRPYEARIAELEAGNDR